MKLPFFNRFSSKETIGIDVGTSSIKMAAMGYEGGRLKLLNYGILSLGSRGGMADDQKAVKFPDQDIVWGIQEIVRQTGIKSREAMVSIPSFSTFATVISLPYLSEKDLAKAIPFESKKHIPIPLEEVIVDWSITNILKNSGGGEAGESLPNVEVFLTAVRKEEVKRYQKIMKEAGFTSVSLELENIALIRSLIGNDPSPLAIVNVGGRSTSILVVDGGYERIGHNYEIGGFEITKSIARSLGIDLVRAEELKKTIGFTSSDARIISEAMFSLVDMMIFETKKTITSYENSKNVKVQKIMLVGGLANMPRFLDYFKSKINLNVSLGNPFARVSYPEGLKSLVPELGPLLSTAVGLAMHSR